MSETKEKNTSADARKAGADEGLTEKDMRRAVIGWLMKSNPSGVGYDVSARLAKIKGNIAAFWSKVETKKGKKTLFPYKTAIVEVRSNRDETISDCCKNNELKELLTQEKRNKLYYESEIREREPELKLTDNLFSDIESWDYRKTKNKNYLKCCSIIERLERSLSKGNGFEKMRKSLVADLLYLAVPRGLISKDELADGWGLLYLNNDMTVDVISHPENWNCPVENRLHLIQNIAKSNIQPICFTNGINLDKNNSPRFVRIPKKRRS